MPLILISNDDGILAPGLRALAEAVSAVGEVVVVAPSQQQSAASHKITLDQPLRTRQLAKGWTAVSGTPADAVFMALHKILPHAPDLVLSGINDGLNIGRDVFYSGTIAAAMEGAMKGLPAIAISQQLDGEEPPSAEMFERAARFTAQLAEAVLKEPMPTGVALNVNIPAKPSQQYAWTTIGDRVYGGEIIERVDPRGGPYFWIGGATLDVDGPPRTDSRAINEDVISISPLAADWNTPLPPQCRQWVFDGLNERNR